MAACGRRLSPGCRRQNCLVAPLVPRNGKVIVLLSLLSALFSSPALAADYLSVVANSTLFYDAPSAKAKKLFVVSEGYPVELVVSLGEWIKVRDVSGKLAWVEKKQLTDKRTVLVSAARADIRQSPEDSAPVVFQAEKGVALEFVENVPGWIKVRHRDGQTGYVRLNQVWGA